jgi:DNA repair exonuclease SbcCD ATPase subunit
MITLQKLKWSNCFSYGADNELDLTESTVTQIIGTNGMGKSSIPLIIEEALYNKNSKGIKKADIPNRYVNSGYSIYLSFSKDQDQYEVDIDRKSNIKLTLTKNGEDISSHTATNTYKTLQEVIGIDFKTFSQLVYQNTNTSLQFLTATDTNRKKFLIDLLHLENYVRLFELFKEESKRSNTNLTSISSKIATIEKWLSDNKLSDTTILPPLEFTISTDEEEKELRSLMIEIQNISEKNKKISTNNHYKDALSKIDLVEVQELSKYEKKSYDSLQSELGSIEQAAAGSQRLLAKLQKLGDHCPTCEQSVDASFKQGLIDTEQTKLQEAEARNAAIREEIERIKEENRKYERGAKLQREWEDLYRSIDSELPSSQLDKDELEERARRVRTDLERAKGELEKISAENEKRARRNTRIEVILEQTDDFQRDLKEHTDLLREEQEIASNLEVLKKAFSTNGLIAYKIENLVGELEELTNSYLAELSDGRFTLEFVVSNDKLNVQVTDNGNIVDILALSSGELARVNTATLIAIRKLMSSISKSRINILFLDEVINVLDEGGREKLVEVLLGEEELNTYVVSHQWYHPLLSRVVINKKDNISYLEHD